MRKLTMLLFGLAFCLQPGLGQETFSSTVERAVLDYVEGFYEGDTAKLHRSVLPEVQKYGYYLPKNSETYVGEPRSFRCGN